MCDQIISYNEKILEYFRLCKISSIYVDGILYDDYNKLTNFDHSQKIIINKKYIKLFEDENFILDNYISNKEHLVKNEKTGRYVYLKISHHARYRLILRYILLTKVIGKECFNDLLIEHLDPIIADLLNNMDDSVTNGKELKTYIEAFIANNIDRLNDAIYIFFKKSTLLKNPSIQFRKREGSHGPTNYFIYSSFIFVYGIDLNLIKTIEIYNINKEFIKSKPVRQKLNKKSNNLDYLLSLIKGS